jgi:hypothetical protein
MREANGCNMALLFQSQLSGKTINKIPFACSPASRQRRRYPLPIFAYFRLMPVALPLSQRSALGM